jgi:hypothetical protein
VVHLGGGGAHLLAKNGQKVITIVEIGPKNHEKYLFV